MKPSCACRNRPFYSGRAMDVRPQDDPSWNPPQVVGDWSKSSQQGIEAGALLGDYRVRRPLGAGGMGRVFLVEQVRTERLYALKLVRSEKRENSKCIARFRREARLLARLHHENIVELHDLSLDDPENCFLVMEYIRGRTLRQELEQHGARSSDFVCEVLGQICRGLGEAHRVGIVHRDLKPENIMLTRHADGRLFVKILDFGVARLYQGECVALTNTEVGIGTAAYMSPEQARGESQLDARSDIFALGVLCYEMLAGRAPYRGASYNEVLFQVANRAHKPLRERCPDLAEPLIQLVETALEKDPGRRFSHVGEVLEQLASLGDGFAPPESESHETTVSEFRTGETDANLALHLVSKGAVSPPELPRARSSVDWKSAKLYLAGGICLLVGVGVGHRWGPSVSKVGPRDFAEARSLSSANSEPWSEQIPENVLVSGSMSLARGANDAAGMERQDDGGARDSESETSVLSLSLENAHDVSGARPGLERRPPAAPARSGGTPSVSPSVSVVPDAATSEGQKGRVQGAAAGSGADVFSSEPEVSASTRGERQVPQGPHYIRDNPYEHEEGSR